MQWEYWSYVCRNANRNSENVMESIVWTIGLSIDCLKLRMIFCLQQNILMNDSNGDITNWMIHFMNEDAAFKCNFIS